MYNNENIFGNLRSKNILRREFLKLIPSGALILGGIG